MGLEPLFIKMNEENVREDAGLSEKGVLEWQS